MLNCLGNEKMPGGINTGGNISVNNEKEVGRTAALKGGEPYAGRAHALLGIFF